MNGSDVANVVAAAAAIAFSMAVFLGHNIYHYNCVSWQFCFTEIFFFVCF